MNKQLYRTEKITVEEGKEAELVLEYYLTQEKHPFKTGSINYLCYGVEIIMKGISDSSFSERQAADEIFSSKDAAMEFIDKLADEKVTPCSLADVVSDMLAAALSQ